MDRQLCIYIDVDDTLVRSVGTKRIPMPAVVQHVRELHRDGALLYCWSSGGADYARQSAEELGLTVCFAAFLPKPNVMVDDQHLTEWPQFLHVHPASLRTLLEYRGALSTAAATDALTLQRNQLAHAAEHCKPEESRSLIRL